MKSFFNLLVIVTLVCVGCYLYNALDMATTAENLLPESYDPDTVGYDTLNRKAYRDDEEYVEYSMELIAEWQKEERNEKNKYNDKTLVGDWFTPDCASCPNVFFRRDKTFSMWDWDDGYDEDFYCTGTYEVKGDSVYLHCKSGRVVALRHWRASKGDKNYYLTKGDKEDYDYWMVKGGL